ncbi:MAG: PT domain-containing protein [Oscillospiraceae bacterium]|nr:PT domain-containing protein [Oscillospiraceae bacterium]
MKRMPIFLIVLALVLSLAACAKAPSPAPSTEPTAAPTAVPSSEPTPDEPDAGLDRIPQSHEDIVLGSTNIVTARYVETVQAFRGDEYVYEVREELKGSAGGGPLHVITSGYVDLPSAMPVSGDDVILFLSGYDSVYQEHVLYILTDIAEDTEAERSLIASLCAGGAPDTAEDGRIFTRSDDIGDILEVTESIFFVRPEEVFVVGTQAPTTTYTCTVLSRLRGEPDIYEELGLPVDPESSEILIPFFNDTVTIGERYLVLLAEHHERSRIYTLSSPYSAMTQEEAALIPELRAILEEAGYDTPAGNTKLCCYSDSGRETSAEADGLLTPEQAASELAKMFMDGLCTESAERSFRVTEYRNLSVDVVRTTAMDEATRAIYFLSEDEIGRDKWIVEISVEYKYEGVKSPTGPSTGEWVDVLYQGSPVGFLMVRDGTDYSLRSRME